MLHWSLQASYLDLPPAFFSLVRTDVPPQPEWVVFNHDLARELGLGDASDADDLAILGGAVPPPGARVFAQAYAGHQYGVFVILGDGRAAVLGEGVAPDGARYDLQLKGSGPTPYARRGDGKAVLGPMLREYLVSEFMHAAGIPSTRSLAVVTTGEPVFREEFQPGAVLCRVASSHLRVGTFEYAAWLDSPEALRALHDYTLRRHYPWCLDSEIPALSLLREVGTRQARTVAQWMQVGFVHGVMNTDNTSISGQSIDFGPCAFLDAYHGRAVFSSIDRHGRYAYGRQPPILGWNLARLAEALLPLIDPDEARAVALAEEALGAFGRTMDAALAAAMSAKLGLSGGDPDATALVQDLLGWMQEERRDFTRTFRVLTDLAAGRSAEDGMTPPTGWLRRWEALLAQEQDPLGVMRRANPVVVPRNRVVQEALDRAHRGDLTLFREILELVRHPFQEDFRDSILAREPADPAAPFVTYCGT